MRCPAILLVAIAAAILIPFNAAVAQSACNDDKLRIAIDIGHSKKRGGALSARGVREFHFNNRFARELVHAARDNPKTELFLISPDNSDIGLRDRPKRAVALKADLFLSIHHDSAQLKYFKPWQHEGIERQHADGIRGFSLFISEENPAYDSSLKLARAIAAGFRKAGAQRTLHHAEPIKGENRRLIDNKAGIYEAPFAVLRHSTIPAVLVEVGVIANKDDEAQLNSKSFRSTLQRHILHAINRFCP